MRWDLAHGMQTNERKYQSTNKHFLHPKLRPSPQGWWLGVILIWKIQNKLQESLVQKLPKSSNNNNYIYNHQISWVTQIRKKKVKFRYNSYNILSFLNKFKHLGGLNLIVFKINNIVFILLINTIRCLNLIEKTRCTEIKILYI